VVGLEADIQGALERDSANLNNPFSAIGVIINSASGPIGKTLISGTVATNYTTQIDWFGTVRGRIGYVWGNGEVLTPTFSLTQAIGHSQVNTGWVAGYGTEGRLGNSNWTWKVEGLYMDLGTVDTTGVTSGVQCCGAGATSATGAQVTTHSHFTDSILRVALNYQFH
jgi:outer membrane immunogenic protein